MAENKYFAVKQSPLFVDPDRLSRRNRELWNTSGPAAFNNLGYGQTSTLAPVPRLNIGSSEKLIDTPSHNLSIRLGNQRGSGPTTEGYGGQGITSPTINMTVGHMGPYARVSDDNGNQILANPNKEIDAASFYVSALDDPDNTLNLPDGSMGNKKALSSIGGIADTIRFRSKGDGGIKFVTLASNRNAAGQKNLQKAGIELITDSDIEPQPLVLGNNLLEVLKELSEDVDNVRETMSSFVKLQGDLNDKVMNHNHNSPFYAQTTAPSFNLIFEGLKSMFKRVAEVEAAAISTIVNKETSQNNYFNPMAEKYILSGLVKTT
jgi:hypothetical protein